MHRAQREEDTILRALGALEFDNADPTVRGLAERFETALFERRRPNLFKMGCHALSEGGFYVDLRGLEPF